MPLERTHPIIPQKAAPGQIRMWGPRRRKGSLPKVAPVVPERAAVPPPARALPPPPWRSSSRRRRRVRWATDRSVPPARPPLINEVYSPIRFFSEEKMQYITRVEGFEPSSHRAADGGDWRVLYAGFGGDAVPTGRNSLGISRTNGAEEWEAPVDVGR